MRLRFRYVLGAAFALTGCAALLDLRDDYVLDADGGGTDGGGEGDIPVSCTNNTLEESESDIDCGGTCPKCGDGKKCEIDADCQSGVCSDAKICEPPRCDDGVKNASETDIDCGGTCPKCALGAACNGNVDCFGSEADAGLADAGVPYNVPLSECVKSQCTTFTARGSWIERTPANTADKPISSSAHSMAYDPVRKRTVLFGGDVAAPALTETWLWNGTVWEKPTVTTPGGRGRYGLAWDSTRNVVVMANGAANGVSADNTSVWNGSTWADAGAGSGSRIYFAMAYDSVRQRMLSYGGSMTTGGTFLGDLRSWDGTTWSTVNQGSPAPGPRAYHGMAFDQKRGTLVVFGGCASDALVPNNETWLWNGTTWTQATPAHAPSPRYSVSLAYDPGRERVILVGGLGSAGLPPLSKYDTWEWNGSTWIESLASIADNPSEAQRLAFDTDRKRGVLSFGQARKTYEYSVVGNACTTGTDCASGFCVDRVCCGTPSCDACESCNQLAAPGTCTPVVNGADPDTCTPPKRCNASSVCE